MPDDAEKRRPRDLSSVHLEDPLEVAWWCGELSCTREELEVAVRLVGPDAYLVRRYLRQ